MQKVFEPYYLVVYKVIPHEESKQFSLPPHRNAKHPLAPPYFRQDPATVAAIDKKLQKGWSTEKVYTNLVKEETDTLSKTLKTPPNNNRKYKLNNKTNEPPKEEN